MTTDDQTQDATTAPPVDDRDRDEAAPPRPRGNQPPEQEWVRRGEEQLEKISGN